MKRVLPFVGLSFVLLAIVTAVAATQRVALVRDQVQRFRASAVDKAGVVLDRVLEQVAEDVPGSASEETAEEDL